MNEIRDLIVGIDFGAKTSQICYYDRKAAEPVSVPVKLGSSQLEIPNYICKKAGTTEYVIGLDAEYFAREKGGTLLDNLYEISRRAEPVQIAEDEKTPGELLAIYLKGLLRYLGVMDIVKNTRILTVTTPSLDAQQVRNWSEAFARMGFSREKCKLMDYEESFYYYIFTQKKDLWNRNIAWYSFDGNDVTYRNFEMKNTEKNVQIRLSEPQYTVLPVEGPVRDAAFARFIRETIKGEFISSVHLNGEGFDQEWAGESIKLMCFQRRKVFYGNNLYARGACASGVEKTEEKNLKNYRFMSSSLVTHSVGMDMRVNGANAFHPLLEAGINWFECSGGCELILDRAEELIFSVSDGVEKWKISMELPGVPKRPNKTTRLSLHMEYVSKDECVITVKDLGFGDLFPSTGKIWKERTNWLKGEAEA